MGAARTFLAATSLSMAFGAGGMAVGGAEQVANKVDAIFTDCTDDVFADPGYSYNQPQPCEFATNPISVFEDIQGGDLSVNLIGSIALGAGAALIIGRLRGGQSGFPNRSVWAKNPKPLK